MHFLELIFYLSCFIILYNYGGYTIIIYVINFFSKKYNEKNNSGFQPGISFIVAAYNEEDCIRQKLEKYAGAEISRK